MSARRFLFTLPLLPALSASAYGATDPEALKICRATGNVASICYSVIRDAAFSPESLVTCRGLRAGAARVLCLRIVANADIEAPLLLACRERGSDWQIVDCLKGVSGKTSAELEFRIVRTLPRPIWAKNYETAEAVWSALWASVSQAGGRCRGYRYVRPESPDWKRRECWSTRYYFDSGAPDPTLEGRYAVGRAAYNHCSVSCRCVAE